MYKLIATGLIAIDVLFLLALPLQAKQVKGIRDCTATITSAQNSIETGRNVTVTVRTSDISESYPDHPTNRPYSYVFLLEGAASESIMNSPKFMKSVATEIINNCGSVGSVTFAVNHTGWGYSIGLIQGRVEFFECLEHDGNIRKLTWGQEYCSV